MPGDIPRYHAAISQVVDKDLLLHRKDRLYAELKQILARQPGPEVAEQLTVYQASLAERDQQMQQVRRPLVYVHTVCPSTLDVLTFPCSAWLAFPSQT